MTFKEVFDIAKKNPGISATGLFVLLITGGFGGVMYIKVSEQRFALMEQRLKQQEDFSKKQKNILDSVGAQFSDLRQTISSINSNVSSLRTITGNVPNKQTDAKAVLKKIDDTLSLIEADGNRLERAISQSASTTNAFRILLSAVNGNEAGYSLDLSEFVNTIYAKSISGATITNIDQINAAKEVSFNDLGPGDLIFFNTMKRSFSHVGIYIGDGKFVHTPTSNSVVKLDSIQNPYWEKRFNGARRVSTPENQPLVEGFSTLLMSEIVDKEIKGGGLTGH